MDNQMYQVNSVPPVSGVNGDPGSVRGFSNLTYLVDTRSEFAEDHSQAGQFPHPAARSEQQRPAGPMPFQSLNPPPYSQQTPVQYNYNGQQPGPPAFAGQPGLPAPYYQQNAPPPGQTSSPGSMYPGAAPYGPPPVQYPVPPQQQQQQQQQIVIIDGYDHPPQHVDYFPTQSFCCHLTLSCFVFWLFLNPLFGIIAFILAAVASNRAFSDRKQAKQLGRASYGVSVAGIIVTVVVVAIMAYIIVNRMEHHDYNSGETQTTTTHAARCPNYYNDNCYPYSIRWSSGDCAFGISVSGYCYYDMMYSCSSSSTEADHDTLGNCYKVSAARCQDAVNYINGVCYKYVLTTSSTTTCHTIYRELSDGSKYCYYSKRDSTSPMFCTLYNSGDSFNDGYCYYN